MKKNLLSLFLVIAFLCSGALVISANTPASSGKPVASAKKLSPAKLISENIAALKAKCPEMAPCQAQLNNLIEANFFYEIQCAPDYQVGCAPMEEANLMHAANIYELCLYWNGYLD